MTVTRPQGFNRRSLLALAGGAAAATALPGPALAGGSSLESRVTPLIDGMVRDSGFQGVVLLGQGGRTRFARATGQAVIERAVPMTTDTPLGIASISKRIKAVAVMRLVDQGKLDLDAPITTWLTDYRADTGARVTLRRLLSNSSGVPNLFGGLNSADPTLINEPMTTREAIATFASGDMVFEPGARFDYAMTNWIIILGVIEAVTGLPYPEAMRALVLNPLRMMETTQLASANATSYRTVAPPTPWISPRPDYLVAAGGYFSTAADLQRFSHGVYDTGFLSPASRRALTTVEVASDRYALGGRIWQVEIGGMTIPAAWETGNTAGYRSVLGHRLDGGGTAVILNNTAVSQRTMDEFALALLRALG